MQHAAGTWYIHNVKGTDHLGNLSIFEKKKTKYYNVTMRRFSTTTVAVEKQ